MVSTATIKSWAASSLCRWPLHVIVHTSHHPILAIIMQTVATKSRWWEGQRGVRNTRKTVLTESSLIPRPPLFCVFVCFCFFFCFFFFYVQYTTWKQILKLRTKRNGVGSLGNNVDKQQTLLYMNYCDVAHVTLSICTAL